MKEDIWNHDRKRWDAMPLEQRIEALRQWFVCPETASENPVADMFYIGETLSEAVAAIIKADRFRHEVLAALIECQDYDRLRNRLMELIDRTAKNAND